MDELYPRRTRWAASCRHHQLRILQRVFGGRESAVGERLTSNGNRYTIVGILRRR